MTTNLKRSCEATAEVTEARNRVRILFESPLGLGGAPAGGTE